MNSFYDAVCHFLLTEYFNFEIVGKTQQSCSCLPLCTQILPFRNCNSTSIFKYYFFICDCIANFEFFKHIHGIIDEQTAEFGGRYSDLRTDDSVRQIYYIYVNAYLYKLYIAGRNWRGE